VSWLYEVLVAIPAVRNLIREAKMYQIGSIIQTGHRHGMQSLDQAMADLVRAGVITVEEAASKASNADELRALLSFSADENGSNGAHP